MSNIYLLYGEEDFLAEEELKNKISAFRQKQPGIEIEYYDSNKDFSEVFSGIFTQLMFSSYRLIILRDFWLLQGSGKNEDEIKSCIFALKGLPDNVSIIFTYAGVPPARNKLFLYLLEKSQTMEFKPFLEWQQEELLRWVIRRLKKENKTIGAHAAELLIQVAGRNMRSLDGEIIKLATYVGTRSHIDEKDVEKIISFGGINAFLYLEALKKKDLGKAILYLERLLLGGEEPLPLIGLLLTYYRMALQVKHLINQGMGLPDIAGRLKAKPFFVKKSAEGLNRFKLEELKSKLSFLLEADLAIKSGNSPQVALELLTAKLCG